MRVTALRDKWSGRVRDCWGEWKIFGVLEGCEVADEKDYLYYAEWVN